MISSLIPSLHDALIAGGSAFGMALLAAALPYVNRKLTEYKPESQALAQILTLMDTLLMGRTELKIGDVDILDVATEAASRVAKATELSEESAVGLVKEAADLWSLRIFKAKAEAEGR